MVGLIGSATAMIPAGRRSTATKIAVAPSRIRPPARASSPAAGIPKSSSSCALPSATGRPPTLPVTPLPGIAVKSATSRSARPRSRAQARMAAPSGCSLDALETGREGQDGGLVEPLARQDRDHARLAFGQRAGLVHHQRVDFLETLQRLGVLDQDSHARAAAHAHHDRHRRRQAERARTGDDHDRNRRDQGVGKRRRRSPDHPGGEGEHGDGDDRGHEPGGHHIGQALDRRAAALRLGDHDARCAPAWCRRPPFRPASPARPYR